MTGPHPPFAVTAAMEDAVAGIVFPNATDDNTPAMLNRTGGYLGRACNTHHEPFSSSIGSITHPLGRRCDYAAELLNLDKQFERILAAVSALGEEANTIVCFASDHGTTCLI